MSELDIGPGVCGEVDDIEQELVCSTREVFFGFANLGAGRVSTFRTLPSKALPSAKAKEVGHLVRFDCTKRLSESVPIGSGHLSRDELGNVTTIAPG